MQAVLIIPATEENVMIQKESGLQAKRTGMSIVVVLAMLISGLAVLATPVSVAEDYIGGPYGGNLRVALQSQPNSLNPLDPALNESAKQVIDVLYDSLGRIDPYTLQLKPWMAQSWSINAINESIVSVKLKDGIKWHDGSDLTLDDVKYTFGASGYNVGYISGITLDAANNTVVFNLVAPDSRFFSEVLVMKIVPSGFTATSAPKGCGPFKFVSSDDDSITVAAFDDHFVARPYIDSMVYTYYPYKVADFEADYPYTQVFADDPRYNGVYRAAYDLIMDKIDFIGWDLLTEDITLNVEVSGNPTNLLQNLNATTVKGNGLKQWYLGFNNAENHILNDPALRQAISYAINKEALTVYDISGGLEKADSSITKYNLPWYNTTITYPKYDITTARKILKDANYDDYDSDGYIDKPGPDPNNPHLNYTAISLTLFGPPIEDVTPYTMSTNIITWFEILGLKVELVNTTMDVHMANILADNFDMYLADEESATLDPQFLNGLYHSSNIATNKNLLNFQGKHKVENYSIMEDLLVYAGDVNQTWNVQLDHSKLFGAFLVYHNETIVSDANYDINMNTGLFTLHNTYVIDYLNDTFNITYNYLAFDSVIEKANSQMNPAMRAKYIKEAQAVLVDLVPSIPLFSYKVSHAYKLNVYVGWVQTLGGINNYWSFTNIKNEMKGASVVTLSGVKNFLNDGESMNLFVKIQDQSGGPVEASHLAMSGEGTFGTPVFNDGQFTIEYTAPATTNSRTITINVEAFTVGYTHGSDSLDITVHPLMKNFNIDISRGATSLNSGNTTSITVIVKDRANNAAVTGANVVITMSPSGLGGYVLDVSGTTNAAGEFVTTFGSSNVTIDTTFRITAYVSKVGYVDAEQTTSISVSRDPTIEVSTDKGFLGLPGPSFMTLLVALTGMSLAFAVYRRRK